MKIVSVCFRLMLAGLFIFGNLSAAQRVYDVNAISIFGECANQLSLKSPDAGEELEAENTNKLCFEISYEAPENKAKKIVFSVVGLPEGLNLRISEMAGIRSSTLLNEHEGNVDNVDNSEGVTPRIGKAHKQIFSSFDSNIVLISNIQEVLVENRRFMIEFPKKNIGLSTAYQGPFSLELKIIDQFGAQANSQAVNR